MATKTFKIGEYAQGGVITAVATKDKITIINTNITGGIFVFRKIV